MGRIHLFEFEDFAWFPDFLRNYGTDFLRFLADKTKMFQPAIPILEKGLANAGNNRIIDLASGGGGGLPRLSSEMLKTNPDLKIILTDYFPNTDAFNHIKKEYPHIDFISESVNAMDVPKGLTGLRTQFLSFHHFKPEDARKILQNAVDSKSPIAIFEGQERSFPSLLAMFLSPLPVLFTAPFIRPFRFGRLIFTYLIPVVPLFVMWDGIVSALRTYSVEEMEELIGSLRNKDDFNWETGKLKSGPSKILYLLGTVKKDVCK